jgi:hypothetical protein
MDVLLSSMAIPLNFYLKPKDIIKIFKSILERTISFPIGIRIIIGQDITQLTLL